MSAVTKGIVMKAPMPLLVAYGIKGIETRTAPPAGRMCPVGVRQESGFRLYRSERVAVVLGKGVFRYDEYPEAWDRLAEAMNWSEGGRDLAEAFRRDQVPGFPLGAVVCTVTVDDALPIRSGIDPVLGRPGIYIVGSGLDLVTKVQRHTSGVQHRPARSERPLGQYDPGRWGWLLGDVHPVPPIPCKGAQGVFRLPDHVTEQLTRTQGEPA